MPLNKSSIKTIAVIGANANRENAMGGGSSQVRPRYEITPLMGLQKIAGNDIGVVFEQGYTITKSAEADEGLISKAVEAARKADVAIVVGGWIHGYDYSKWDDNAYDTEGFDKPNLKMPFGQDELIKAVIKANPNTVVVLYGGGAIDMMAWVKGAKAVIQAGYPGMEGGNALAKILFGEVNPSGKLTVTFPQRLEDIPAHKLGEYPGDSINVRYNEDIFVGYRYFDTYKVKPLFSFGHGLSYTKYKYGKAAVSVSDTSAVVRFTLQNTGARSGAEVVQVYVADRKSSLKRPAKELKAFRKVFLRPGESKEVELKLDKSAFSFYDDRQGDWVLEPGEFDILIGSSSSDIRSKSRVKL